MSQRTDYLWRQIQNHVQLFFTAEAKELLGGGEVEFVTLDQALNSRKLAIVIPTDISIDTAIAESCDTAYQVDFNGSKLTLINKIKYSLSEEWTAIPNDNTPLWYQHKSGTVIPASNLYATLLDLLTFNEERRSTLRDSHKRFVGNYSPRDNQDTLEIPFFNEAVAALVAALAGIKKNGAPQLELPDLLKPPVAVLSHDCDILLGNDSWTQIVRAYRVALPLRRLRPPAIANLWWILRNYLTPRRFYFDNIAGMVELERIFGYTSTFYLINGSFGRYGARSGSGILSELVETIPKGWDVGIHYNYDTYLSEEMCQAQLAELSKITQSPIECGRAHYLRYDSEKSPKFLESAGILVDESAGYPDRIGYRCGVGGCVAAYDSAKDEELNIYSVPLNVMETTLVNQYPTNSIEIFSKLAQHTACIGGAISVLMHPGLFYNPEHPKTLGLYHKILQELRDVNATSRTALSLAKELI